MVAATLTLGVVIPAKASAATYKVGPSQTYKTLGAVASMLSAGDIVEIDGDATYAGGVAFWNAGSPSAKITIRGIRKNGKRPVISGGTNTIEAAGNHYVFEGLELTGGSFRCFFHHAHDITLRDSVVRNCPAHGVLGADSDSGSLTMEYVEVYGCGNGTSQHQIYMATDESTYPGAVFRMQHCYVHSSTGGNNVKSRAERNEIYYNWIEGATYHELELIGPDGQNPALKREDSDVVGNVLLKTKTTYVVRFGGDGTGETDGRYRFVNNTVITQPGGAAVFRLFDGIESLSAHNNVFYVAGGGAPNLVRQVEAVWTSGSAKISGSNNWTVTGSANVPSSWTGTKYGTNPGFVNASSYDVRLTAASPLVNAGSATTPDPSGYTFPKPLATPAYHPPLEQLENVGTADPRTPSGAIDIGAFEYATSGSGGTGGSGGSGGTGGSTGGSGGTGGSTGGSGGTGGSTGGSGGTGGSTGGSGGTGGSTGGSGGVAGAGASAGAAAGGAAGAGSGGYAGAASGGVGGEPSVGGSSGSAGDSGSPSSSGGSTSAVGGSAGGAGLGAEEPDGDLDGGCACSAAGSGQGGRFGLVLAGLALALVRRRRQRHFGSL